MTTHSVGPGAYRTIAEAVSQASEGDVIEVQAGNYVDDFLQIYVGLTLRAVEGRVFMSCTRQPPNGKAMVTTSGNVTIEGFDISGISVPDQNGAAVRYEGNGTLTLDQVFFHHNENGVMGGEGDHVVIRNSEFSHNGNGSGQTHNIYIGHIKSLTVDNCYFHDANVGHNIKSRAGSTTITNSRVFDLEAGTSYSIDAPNGGDLVIEDCVVQQGPNTQNPAVIAYGEEGVTHPGINVRIARNVFVNDAQRGNEYLVMNRSGRSITIEDNTIYGLRPDQLGDVSERNTDFTDTRPEVDETPMDFDDGGTEPPPDVIELPPPDVEEPPPDVEEPPIEPPPGEKPPHGHTPTHDPSDPGGAHVKGEGGGPGKSDEQHGKGQGHSQR